MSFRKKSFSRKPRRFLKKRVSRKPRGTKVSFAVKKYVKRTLHSQIENKNNSYGVTASIGNIYSSNTLNVTPLYLFPSVQDASQAGRIGNQICVRKLKVNYILWPTPYDPNLNPEPRPQEVMITFGRLKRCKNEMPTATDFTRYYDMGSSAFPPTGDIRDCISQVNMDLFTVFATRRHKIGTANYQGDNSTNPKPDQYWANNDFKYNHQGSIVLTKHMNKVQKFDDVNSSYGTSQVYMWANTVNADGTLLTTASITPVQFYYWVTCEYEDA